MLLPSSGQRLWLQSNIQDTGQLLEINGLRQTRKLMDWLKTAGIHEKLVKAPCLQLSHSAAEARYSTIESIELCTEE